MDVERTGATLYIGFWQFLQQLCIAAPVPEVYALSKEYRGYRNYRDIAANLELRRRSTATSPPSARPPWAPWFDGPAVPPGDVDFNIGRGFELGPFSKIGAIIPF